LGNPSQASFYGISPLEDFILHSKPHPPSSTAQLGGVFSCLLIPTETENDQRSTTSLKSSKVQKGKGKIIGQLSTR